MKTNNKDNIICRITYNDIHEVSKRLFGRPLSSKELGLVEKEFAKGDLFDWQSPVENLLRDIVDDYKLEDINIVEKLASIYDDDIDEDEYNL
jgi:hypothetical protein